jgi:hypothetical protein
MTIARVRHTNQQSSEVSVSIAGRHLFQIEPQHSTVDRDHCAGHVARSR